MHRLTKLLITILFPLALISGPISMLLPVEPVEIENRALNPPQLTLENLGSIDFLFQVLSYVRAANPLRTLLIRAGAGVDYWVFDDSPDPTRVLKGTDDWLFFRPTMEEACTVSPDIVARNVTELVARLESDVPTVVFTVAPSKFVIHPEHLTTDQARLAECARLAGKRLREILTNAEIEHYVDGWDLFETLKADGVQPYFRTDTHFNFEGSIPWMKALIDEIAPVWDPDHVRHLGQTNWLGNLMRFIGLDEPESVNHVVVNRGLPLEPEDAITGVRVYRHESRDVTLIPGAALIIGDSFMELPRPSLVQFFEEVAVVDWRDEEGAAYFMRHASDSDVVIVEVSELDIWLLFADTAIADAYQSE